MAERTTAAAALDRDSSVPLWMQLCADITRRLDAGAFTSHFPGEHQLVAEYRVSRHTVREALRTLRERGVLESRQGRSTRVRLPRIEQPVGALYSLFRAVESRGIEQRSEVRALDIRGDARVARLLRLPAGTEFVYLERLRLAGGEPLALDHTWLPRQIAEPLLDADFRHAALYRELAARTGVRLTSGRERIHAVAPDNEVRRALRLPPDGAVFHIERQGMQRTDQGIRAVEWRETLVRGDRLNLTGHWSEQTVYQLSVAGTVAPPPGHAPPGHAPIGQALAEHTAAGQAPAGQAPAAPPDRAATR